MERRKVRFRRSSIDHVRLQCQRGDLEWHASGGSSSPANRPNLARESRPIFRRCRLDHRDRIRYRHGSALAFHAHHRVHPLAEVLGSECWRIVLPGAPAESGTTERIAAPCIAGAAIPKKISVGWRTGELSSSCPLTCPTSTLRVDPHKQQWRGPGGGSSLARYRKARSVTSGVSFRARFAGFRTGTNRAGTSGYSRASHLSTSARDPSRRSISLPASSKTNAQYRPLPQ